MNTFGKNLRLTTFGESHGPAMGGIIDGFPSCFKIDFEKLQLEIDKRRPGSSLLVTQRKESDRPEFLSGISPEGLTLGTPIGFIIRNQDQHSGDYAEMAELYRPNHADFTYDARYHIRDYRGGGRASARETVNWTVAGALALQWLEAQDIHIEVLLTGVGHKSYLHELKEKLIHKPGESGKLSVPGEMKKEFEEEVLRAKNAGDSIGGTVTCIITGLKAGVGNPVFGKLQASLAQAMMSINAAKSFEYGAGNDSTDYTGIESADLFYKSDEGKIQTSTNFSGGIQGGISNGMPIYFTVTFKPTPTVMQPLMTVTASGEGATLKARGRHDPCVAIRGAAVVKAMASLVVADYLL